MRRLPGIKRNELTKVLSSSDEYMRNRGVSGASDSDDAPPSSPPPLSEEDFEPVNEHEHEESEHVSLISSGEVEHVDGSEEGQSADVSATVPAPPAQENPQDKQVNVDDPDGIYNKLANYDPNAPSKGRGGGARQGGPQGHTPPANILQRKEPVEKSNTPTPKISINMGGAKKPTPTPPPKVEVQQQSETDKNVNKTNTENAHNTSQGTNSKNVHSTERGEELSGKKNTNQQNLQNSSSGDKRHSSNLGHQKQQENKSAHNTNKPVSQNRSQDNAQRAATGKSNNTDARPAHKTSSISNLSRDNTASAPEKRHNSTVDTTKNTNTTQTEKSSRNAPVHEDPSADVKAMTESLKKMSGIAETLAKQTRETSKEILQTTKQTVQSLSDQSKDTAETLAQGVQIIAQSVDTAIETMSEGVRDTAEALARGSEAASFAMVDNAKEASALLSHEVREAVSALAESTKNASDSMLESSKDSSEQMVQGARAATETLITGTQEVTDSLLTSTQDVTESLTESVKETSLALAESTKEATDKMSTTTREVAEHIAVTSSEATAHMAEGAREASTQMAKSAEQVAKTLSENTRDNVTNLIEITKKATEDLTQTAKTSAEHLLSVAEQATKEIASVAKTAVEKGSKQTVPEKSNNSFLEKQIQLLQSQVLHLQKQMQSMATSNSAGMPIVQGPVSVPPAFAAPLDSFVDSLIDYTEHTPSYDPSEVSSLLVDLVDNTSTDDHDVYKVVEKMYGEWIPDVSILAGLKQELISKHANMLTHIWKNTEKQESMKKQITQTVENKHKDTLTDEQRNLVCSLLIAEVLGIGKLQPLMDDRDVTEIMTVGFNRVFCIVNGEQKLTDIKFDSAEELDGLARGIAEKVGRTVSMDTPHCDAKLENGTRVHIIIPPASANGQSIITMRKPPASTKPVGLDKMVELRAMTVEMVEFLKMCVKGKANIILYGETNSGKTTVTRAMSNFFGPNERVISLEDTQELNLQNFHYVPLEAVKRKEKDKTIGIHELFVDVLRMSPERLIVGEVRGAEGGDMVESMQSGQRGGITTLHAGSPPQVTTRLVIMMSRAEFNISEEIMRRMIHDSIDLMIQCRRLPDGTRKITRITEVLPIDEANRLGVEPFKDIFKFDQVDLVQDEFENTLQVLGDHQYKNHLSLDKRVRFFEFGTKIPDKFGGLQ